MLIYNIKSKEGKNESTKTKKQERKQNIENKQNR